jgi:hypothetical protein
MPSRRLAAGEPGFDLVDDVATVALGEVVRSQAWKIGCLHKGRLVPVEIQPSCTPIAHSAAEVHR